MADNKKTATSKKASSKAPTNSESPRILQALKLMANFCVLKYCSDREHPLRSEDVSNIIFTYSGTNCDARETKRKLVYLTNLHLRAQNEIEISVTDTSIPPLPDRDECYYIDTIITSLTGGYIAATEKSYGRRFWFEQLMDCSDAELIQGAITSNQYLSGEEKDFLVTCLKNIFPPNISKYTNAQYLIDFTKPTKLDANTMAALLEEKFQNTMDSYTLPYNPKRTQKINNNFSQKGTPDLMNFLETVNVLRDAIENGLQVELTYGEYGITNGKIQLVKKENSPYNINPHAMIWNDGHYYLLCTFPNAEKPRLFHYRIDRILSVKIATEEDLDKKTHPLSIDISDFTEDLKKYFTNETIDLHNSFGAEIQRTIPVFDNEAFRVDHPLMSYSTEEKKIITATLHCPARRLSTIIDAFGLDQKRIKIEPIELTPEQQKLGYFSDKDFAVTIKKVELSIIQRFCKQLQNEIFAVAPLELVNALREDYKRAASYYDTL